MANCSTRAPVSGGSLLFRPSLLLAAEWDAATWPRPLLSLFGAQDSDV